MHIKGLTTTAIAKKFAHAEFGQGFGEPGVIFQGMCRKCRGGVLAAFARKNAIVEGVVCHGNYYRHWLMLRWDAENKVYVRHEEGKAPGLYAAFDALSKRLPPSGAEYAIDGGCERLIYLSNRMERTWLGCLFGRTAELDAFCDAMLDVLIEKCPNEARSADVVG